MILIEILIMLIMMILQVIQTGGNTGTYAWTRHWRLEIGPDRIITVRRTTASLLSSLSSECSTNILSQVSTHREVRN